MDNIIIPKEPNRALNGVNHSARRSEFSVLIKTPLPMDSLDPEVGMEKNQFYIKNGCYYTRVTLRGKTIEKVLSNFTMEILYHISDDSNDSKRLIKFQRKSGEIAIHELSSSQLDINLFKKTVRSFKGKGLLFSGNLDDLQNITRVLFDNENEAEEITTFGQQINMEAYAFSNCIINQSGEIYKFNDAGIARINEECFYSAPVAQLNSKTSKYKNEKEFALEIGLINVEEFIDLLYQAYGAHGVIGFSFVTSALFRDIIFKRLRLFPWLFLFGDQGDGKSTFASFLMSLFGNELGGHSLFNSTSKALSRLASQRRNALLYLKEYSNDIERATLDFFTVGYDGELYTMAQKSVDNKTLSLEILSAAIVDGNELPSKERAQLARMIVLFFGKSRFTNESTDAYNKLEEARRQGLGQIIMSLYGYRSMFKNNYKITYDSIFNELKNKTEELNDFDDRQVRHIAFLLCPFKLLEDQINLPISYESLQESIIESFMEQVELIKDISDINIFWASLAHKRASSYKEVLRGLVYYIDEDKEILYLKLKEAIPYYNEYVNRNNLQRKDFATLKSLLTGKGNKCFVRSKQGSRPGVAYTHAKLGSCYQFKFKKGNYGIIMNKHEYKL
ncbi:hypothetical protein [Marinifilum fragile]|uniref:hypothetical protein n=1 Tax=Marinifilum fragile TaxID=570161 RepID=UPI002AAB4F76|nr:hypothetical protein [Marinifilum fragile]